MERKEGGLEKKGGRKEGKRLGKDKGLEADIGDG